MQLSLRVLRVRERLSPKSKGQVYLCPGDWDDYSFKTSFDIVLLDDEGKSVSLGTTKIGYKGQPKGWTHEKLPEAFESLPDGFFSLGQDVKYYKNAYERLTPEIRTCLLQALRDIVFDDAALSMAAGERVFKESLTRGVSLSTVRDQFKRVLGGQPELTDFDFIYSQNAGEKSAAVNLHFQVRAGSIPSTNVHVLIGRNGVGKTTLLNNMVRTLMGQPKNADEPDRGFLGEEVFLEREPLPQDYFSSVVSVSFSAFDPFVPPEDRPDRSSGPAFFYIGMKKTRAGKNDNQTAAPKTSGDLVSDFVASFKSCLSQPAKRDRWAKAIRRLESDLNFADMALTRLIDLSDRDATKHAGQLASRMSSGHSIVLLTITKLVDTVEEKTLVLLDEPESHLHPPLLSAFTRALSDLLHDRNGVAIVATHSPVVLQEVPKSCVWKLTRIRAQGRSDRPERETFGENVGVLTREVFGLEVSKAGFHELLERSVVQGGSFDEIMQAYGGQIGTEAQAILLSLVSARDAAAKVKE
jgi:predicted ATPase